MTDTKYPRTKDGWKKALDSLPATPQNIPAFFFAHGSPMLAFPDSLSDTLPPAISDHLGPTGSLANFLRDFGPALLHKYKPKGVLVFSAHWETHGERLVTNYGDDNPLLMDYYGFQSELYQLKFKSRGDIALANRVVELYKEAGQNARLSNKDEPRGQDGRGFMGPGLDHGVFVPFRLMFGHESLDIPVVQVSIDESLDPEINWAIGKAVAKLREEGILILSGGLTVHNLRNFTLFSESTASPVVKDFDKAIVHAAAHSEPMARKDALINLVKHRGFRSAHPREEHFVPLYVAAGAGEDGGVRVLNALYGAPTFAFGL